MRNAVRPHDIKYLVICNEYEVA